MGVVLTILLAILLVFGLYNYYSKANKRSVNADADINVGDKDSIDHCLSNFQIALKYNGVKISNFALEDRKDSLSDFLKKRNKPILVLRLKESYCNLCVDNELNLLGKYMRPDSMNIVLFGTYSSTKLMNIALSREKMNMLAVFNIPPEALNILQLDKTLTPYYFILLPNLRITSVFIPEKAYPKLTRQYLESAKQIIGN